MKTLSTLTLACALAASSAVYAQSANDQAIKSDVNSINKDNADVSTDQNALARNRAQKAADSANGHYGSEAVDSAKIVGNHAAIGVDDTKKSIDQSSLRSHKKQVSSDNSDPNTSVNQ